MIEGLIKVSITTVLKDYCIKTKETAKLLFRLVISHTAVAITRRVLKRKYKPFFLFHFIFVIRYMIKSEDEVVVCERGSGNTGEAEAVG